MGKCPEGFHPRKNKKPVATIKKPAAPKKTVAPKATKPAAKKPAAKKPVAKHTGWKPGPYPTRHFNAKEDTHTGWKAGKAPKDDMQHFAKDRDKVKKKVSDCVKNRAAPKKTAAPKKSTKPTVTVGSGIRVLRIPVSGKSSHSTGTHTKFKK